MMNLITILYNIMYPSMDKPLYLISIFVLTWTVLPLLVKHYENKYEFDQKDKKKMEILSVTFMILGTVLCGNNIPIITWAILSFLFVTDSKYKELPDLPNLLIALFSLLSVIPNFIVNGFVDCGVLTGIIMFVFFFILALLGPMGGGDIKMMGALGLYFTMWEIPSVILYGFLIGTIHGMYLMIVMKQGRKAEFPFGPSLILGVLIYLIMKGVA